MRSNISSLIRAGLGLLLLIGISAAARADQTDALTKLGQQINDSVLLEGGGSQTAPLKSIYATAGASSLVEGLGFAASGDVREQNQRTMARIRDQQARLAERRVSVTDRTASLDEMRSRMSNQQWKLADMRSRMSGQQWKLADMRSRISDQQWKMADMRSRMSDQQERLQLQGFRMRELQSLNQKALDRFNSPNLGLESLKMVKEWYTYRADLRSGLADLKFDYFRKPPTIPSSSARIPSDYRVDPGLILDTRIRLHDFNAGTQQALRDMRSAGLTQAGGVLGGAALNALEAKFVANDYRSMVTDLWNRSSPTLPAGRYNYNVVNGQIRNYQYTPPHR